MAICDRCQRKVPVPCSPANDNRPPHRAAISKLTKTSNRRGPADGWGIA